MDEWWRKSLPELTYDNARRLVDLAIGTIGRRMAICSHATPILLATTLVAIGSLTPLFAQDPDAAPVPVPIPEPSSDYAHAIESHMDYLTEHSRDETGEESTAMWLATIDIRTNILPQKRLPHRRRWYRHITSPEGSNLYWDQPSIVAAYELAERTGCACFEDAADAYIRDFLDRCIAEPSGLFDWGNHRYYDVVKDRVAQFSGGYHELRPHTPAWETFWEIDPEKTERAIRAMALAHIKDPQTGRFCRHSDPAVKPGSFSAGEVENAMPFLEAGATLIDSLCWLAAKTDDRDGDLARSALQVARYSFAQRNRETLLVRNQPIDRRWDFFASTTEVGLWAGSLLKAADYTGNDEFRSMADAAMRPWLASGFDSAAGKYFGGLWVQTGKPIIPEEPRGYSPPRHAEVFDTGERPTHNYPMQMAEACLDLFQSSQEEVYGQAVGRWVEQIRVSLPANEGKGAYAEDYGRAIHFLVRASDVMERSEWRDLARAVADEAMEQLFVPRMGMFRSHPGEERCDAVDGPGILILGLMYLDGGELPESAFHF